MMYPVTFSLPEKTLRAAELLAQQRGYISLQEYVVDFLRGETEFSVQMNPELREALQIGLDDAAAGRVHGLSEVESYLDQQAQNWRAKQK